MLRAVGCSLLLIDSLFFAFSQFCDTSDDGVSIGVVSLILSVLELLTELRYYAAEAGADTVTRGEEPTGTAVADRDSIELANHAPSLECRRGVVGPRVGLQSLNSS